jgi:polysaccharide export outer membrane protein
MAKLLIALIALICLVAITPFQAYALQAAPASAATLTDHPALREYQLGPSDKLRVIVYGNDALSGEFLVSSSGTISFPLVGELNVAGQTVDQVRHLLQEGLKHGYLNDPRVSIEVDSYRPFYILGEVNKPGEYPFTPNLTLEGAVATAQGFTYRANTQRIYIRHSGEQKEEKVKTRDLRSIWPGDVIRVTERFF